MMRRAPQYGGITADMKINLNFLRFLVSLSPTVIFSNRLLEPLFERIEPAQIEKEVYAFLHNGGFQNAHKGMDLYVSVPYCAENCNFCYCPHYSKSGIDTLSGYWSVVLGQSDGLRRHFSSIKFNSLFFGGGTPSLLETACIKKIFAGLFRYFNFTDDAQIAFEGHPTNLSSDKISALKEAGVGRISLGIQTLDPGVLKTIKRNQAESSVYACIENIRKQRIPYLNIDLIAGLPSQSRRSFIGDLKKLLKFKPELIHINPFSGTPATNYIAKNAKKADVLLRERGAMIIDAKKMLDDHGYRRYGFEGYQLGPDGGNYQEFSFIERASPFLGLGIRAVSNLTGRLIFENFPGERSNAVTYMGISVTERYAMASYAALHILEGLDERTFKAAFNKDIHDIFAKELRLLSELRLVEHRKDRYVYNGKWKMGDLFNYFSYTKLFYDNGLLRDLAKIYKPSKDYGSQDYLLSFMNDYEIQILYYGTGF